VSKVSKQKEKKLGHLGVLLDMCRTSVVRMSDTDTPNFRGVRASELKSQSPNRYEFIQVSIR